MASFWAHFVGGLGLRLLGCVVWSIVQLAAACHEMRRLVRRENAAPDPDLADVCTASHVEVGVCVAPEPHGLGEGSSNACVTVVACTVVGLVAVGCSWARFTVILRSRKILSLFGPTGAATRPLLKVTTA